MNTLTARTPRRLAALLALLAPLTAAASAGTAVLDLEVAGITATEGRLMVALYPNAERYRRDAMESRMVEARAGTMQLRFDGLPPGEYAIAVFHDRNGNGRLDTNVMGMPTEPAAFSGRGGAFGPPAWPQASFRLTADGARVLVRLPE
jgi:uncharacterized protein (DUF2141 family)